MHTEPDIYLTYQMMERNNIILSFKGHITKDLLASVYQIMESRLESINDDNKKKKKVYHILVESLQNIYHHMDELRMDEDDLDAAKRDSMFMIVRGEDSVYNIHTGNFILNTKCDLLKSKLDHINTLSAEELRAQYVDRLNSTELSEKGGAGLGIIDIARKSGNKLGYSFNAVSEKYSFFSLIVKIS